MNQALADALLHLPLEPGTYHVQIDGYDVEIRIVTRKAGETATAASYDEADVMLEPWVELPTPKPIGAITAYPAPPPPLDIPEIPKEDEWS